MKNLFIYLIELLPTVKYYRRLKRRYAELDHHNEMWRTYLAAPSNVKIKNNF